MTMILFFIYLINLYIRPQDWVPYFLKWPVDYIVIIPTLLIGYFTSYREKRLEIPQHRLLFGFLICIFLSNVVHGDFAFGWQETVLFLKKVCIFYVFFFILTSQRKLAAGIWFILLLSVILGVEAIYQSTHGGIGWAGQGLYKGFTVDRVRWIGLWDGANIFALLLSLAVPLALEFGFGIRRFIPRLLGIVSVGILGYSIYLTNSKGGFITFLATMFFYFSFRMKRRSGGVIVLILVALIALAFAPSRLSITAVTGDTGRAHLWEQGIEWFKENPVLGIGKGHFRDDSYHHLVAHSNFIQNLAEVGFLGVFLFMGLIYFSFKGLLLTQNTLKKLGKTNSSLFSSTRAILISFIGFNVCTLFITMEIDIFYAWLGLCASTFSVLNREYTQVKMGFSGRDARNIFLIFLALLFGYWLKT